MNEKSTVTLMMRRLTPGFVFRVVFGVWVFSSTGFEVGGELEISAIVDPRFCSFKRCTCKRLK